MSSPNEGLVTVQGEVAEDGYTMSVCLRSEAGIHSFNVGDQINLSHMKLNHSSYGPQLHSTTYTKTETKVEDRAEVLIIGVATSEKPKQLEVLLDDGESLFIDYSKSM
ncbi:unnamed protein product [Oreochromis niloticus]|nr:unnamed protein product [Mustela putorius furo]